MEREPMDHPIDKRLEEKLSIKKPRTGKISMSFGVSDL
jgi:hypothetical protein